MPRDVHVFGFETQDYSGMIRHGDNTTEVIQAGAARSGGFGLKTFSTVNSINAGMQVAAASMLHTPAGLQRHDHRWRYFFRPVVFPTVSGLFIGGIGASHNRLEMNTTGQLRLFSNTAGTYGATPCVLNHWYRADHRLFGLMPGGAGASAGRQKSMVIVYDCGVDGLQTPVQIFTDTTQPTPRITLTEVIIGTGGGFYLGAGIGSCANVAGGLLVPADYFFTYTNVPGNGGACGSNSPANGDYRAPFPTINLATGPADPGAPCGGIMGQGNCQEFGGLLGLQLYDFTAYNAAEAVRVFIGQASGTIGGVSCIREIHYDDLYLDWRSGADADTLDDWPRGTRAYLFVPTSQGPLDQFTPATSPARIADVPNAALSIASTASGQESNYQHAALATPTDEVYAVRVAGLVGSSGGTSHFFLIGADQQEIVASTGFSDQANGNTPSFGKFYATPKTAAQFLALTLGLKSGPGVFTVHNFWMEALAGPPLVLPEIELARGEGQIGLAWVERQDNAGDIHVSSKIALPDPDTYYHGFKKATIVSWGRIRRALSDRNGQYEGTDFSWVESDVDRFIRTQLSNESTRFFVNQGFTVRMISDPDRRLLLTPRTVVKGILRNYRPLSPLHFEFSGQDILAAKFAPLNSADQLPQRVITVEDFPTCPTDILGLAVPIIYGEVSDKNEETSIVPGTPGVAGKGLAKPANLTATVVGGAGSKSYSYGVTALDNRDRQHQSFASRKNHAGETDAAYVSITNAPDLDEMSETRYVELDWDNVAGAHHYRIYGRAHRQTLTLNLLDSAKATGAGKEERYNDGERNGHAEVDREKTDSHPPKKNNTVVGGNPGTPESTITTDRGKGVVPTIYVGERTIGAEVWSEFLVCGHAIKAILGVYRKGVRLSAAELTANFLIPGSAEWTAALGATTYRDYNGHRYTVIYVRGEDAENARDKLVVSHSHGLVTIGIPPISPPSANATTGDGEPITLNVQGIEDVGDSTGVLITSLPLQYRHMVVNWLLQSYLAGAWLATPVFPDDADLTQIDEDSFDAVDTVAQARIAGGYVGGWIIGTAGELVGVRDMIAKLNVNCDCDSGFNRKTQFMVSMVSEAISQVVNAGLLTDVIDIFSGSFDIEDRVDDLFNFYDYRYARNYANTDPVLEWQTGNVQDSVSITNYRETKKAPLLDLEMIRSAAIATDIVTRKLLRTKAPPRVVKLETGLHGFNYELGDIITLTHYEGIGPGGWAAQPVRIIRHEADPNSYSVSLECFDMGAMFGTSGGGGGPFILGDETILPASWATTTPAQKTYGYLADETTGAFADGLEGKHLR